MLGSMVASPARRVPSHHPSLMKVRVIGNPQAGRGRGRNLIEAFRAQAPTPGVDVSVALTRCPGDGVRLARELAGGADVVGIIGGDGTVHEVVNGLMPHPVPIAILPCGTGNDFASLFDCPQNPRGFADVLRNRRGARVDVLDFGDRFCVNSAGLGFEGQVNQRSHGIRGIHGPPLYLVAVFKTLSSLACPYYELTLADGERIDGERLMVSIGNGNRTGGSFHLTPDACPDDGLIDVCIVDPMRWPQVVAMLPGTFRGRHVRRSEVRMLRTERLTIETKGEHPMHIDGELIEITPPVLEITVRKRVLPVLCGTRSPNPLRHNLEVLLSLIS